ncbi:MAG: hypothetical protein ABEI86_14825 [Halobacteriaceae archaeon]
MYPKSIAIVVTVMLTVVGGAAALPGNAPVDTPADENTTTQAQSSSAQNGTDRASAQADSPNASVDEGQVGPPDSLPEPVPDFVPRIHEQIQKFINGTIDQLGKSIAGIVGNR